MPKKYRKLPQLTSQQIDRFWSKIVKAGPDECWLWTASTSRNGYGQFAVVPPGEKIHNIRANRLAYFLTTGKDPGTMNVMHSCDNPPCCNPAHLSEGTDGDNIRDCYQKGRMYIFPVRFGDQNASRRYPERLSRGDNHYARTNPERLARGEAHGNSILTDDTVRTLRARAANGATYRGLARETGLSRVTIKRAVKGETWRHVE